VKSFNPFPHTFYIRCFLVIICVSVLFFTFIDSAVANTWIVDQLGGPGYHFTDIPPAISAASDGDLILVRDGTYTGFTLNIGLTISAETSHTPSLGSKKAVIEFIPAGKSVRFTGFSMKACNIRDCHGFVFVDDCEMGPTQQHSAIILNRCEHVVLSRCTAKGVNVGSSKGAHLLESKVVITQCKFSGSGGYDGYYSNGGPGSPGLHASDSSVFFLHSSSKGGYGGDGHEDDFKIFDGGDGAPGILAEGSYIEIFGISSDLISGGWGGYPSNWYAYYGEDAHAVEGHNSRVIYSGATFTTGSYLYVPPPKFGGSKTSFIKINPKTPVMHMEGKGEVGTSFQATLYEPAGSGYLLFLSPSSKVTHIGWGYTQLFLDPMRLFIVTSGVTPPTGEVEFDFHIPNLPEYIGLAVHMQSYVSMASKDRYLSTPINFVIK